jgi:hypothetical protein
MLPMGAREELVAAAKALARRGVTAFSPMQLMAEARAQGCTYPDSTLRTFIVSAMCVNSPNHHAVQYDDFERVGRAQYRLRSAMDSVRGSVAPSPRTLTRPEQQKAPTSAPITHVEEWFWEGNVQAAVVRHLATGGWHIRRVAGTASSEHGIDVEADRHSERILIEVKGYPGTTYARGERKGQTKTTTAAPTQARTYFSNALLAGLLMRAEGEIARVALVFPDVPTFSNLGRRVVGPLQTIGIEVWLVRENGNLIELGPRAELEV